ncbi:MAG: SpoIIE family protein phosphatase [Candidatus Solibacter usitatus]|nr:SpoIIE family protein phosphatase [Candidatus Solibacter usitatus]
MIVVDPSGNRTTMPLLALPFRIGRQADNQLIMRDSRASRNHARIVMEEGEFWVEDLKSRHGTFVNGGRVTRFKLKNSDRIEFGSPDSYQLIFTMDSGEMNKLLEQFPSPEKTGQLPGGPAAGNLAKLRAVMEVARALQTSLSTQDVLTSVVDAALAVTGAERGFLLLRRVEELEMRVARDRRGVPLAETDLQVPRRLIQRALQQRRELLSMNFDPAEEDGMKPEHSVADLDLRSVVCVPLVRIRVSGGQETSMLSTFNDTVGVLYMDSRIGHADMSAGNRELLQTLALEASTILENARLLEEERMRQKMDEELNVARQIQQSLFPRRLPSTGWFRARGTSEASQQVGGDYFDVMPVNDTCWAAAVADVSGKGVSSALLACYLQGALSAATSNASSIEASMELINRFLGERAEAGKYATIFYCILEATGRLRYINAGHCAPFVVHLDSSMDSLDTTGVPVGLLPWATFPAEECTLAPGDKIVIYSDGVSEAHGPSGEFYGTDRLRDAIRANVAASCEELQFAILDDVRTFTQGAPQADDVTLVILEYVP